MTAIRDYVDSLDTHESTAIYSALDTAYQAVAAKQAADPSRLFSIVLMTDGENNAGLDPAEFTSQYQSYPAAVRGVAVFPILFGDAKADAMQQIADLTGGRLFDAKTTPLGDIFKQIRGYQ
jgi:Ca-activated chloride channel family protein